MKNHNKSPRELEEQEIVHEVYADFESRKLARKDFESKWKLGINFLMGNQYCFVAPDGDIATQEKNFYWQERLVFNHIAPIVESRLAKLGHVRPTMSVRPASDEEKDIKASLISKKIIEGISRKVKLSEVISSATLWSEACGTAFYKIIWNANSGKLIGTDKRVGNIFEGDVEIISCSPFEVFPDNQSAQSIDDCMSIIHAKAFSVDEIYNRFNVTVKGENIDVFSLDRLDCGDRGVAATIKVDHCIVIEKYCKPTAKYPNGRLIIVAGNQLLHDGELSFINRENNQRSFPFVKQVCISQVGCFWGTSIVERVIPIQKSFNAVRNRKQEFLNRISTGIVAVEDGAVDVDILEQEGLSPGKILVYRQGATPPSLINIGSVPSEFVYEEERLISEFAKISGVSEFLSSQSNMNGNISGIALQLLLEQDDIRIGISADSIRFAIKNVTEQVLRLYRQYATHKRLITVSGEGGDTESFYFSNSDINSFDVVFQTENEMVNTPSQRKAMALDLLQNGLLHDENGKIPQEIKGKVLQLFGFGNWETANGLITLHIKKADKENLIMLKDNAEVCEIDNHDLHVTEHTRYMLSGDYNKQFAINSVVEKRFLKHIRLHKELRRMEKNVSAEVDIKKESRK